jgi:hypothetical protein
MIFPIDAGRPVNGRDPPVEEVDPVEIPVPLLPVSPVPELPVEPDPLTAAVVEVVVVDAFALAAAVVEVVEEVLVDEVVPVVDEVVVEPGVEVVVVVEVGSEVVVVVESGSVVLVVDVVVVGSGSVVVVVDVVVVESGSVVLVVDDEVVVVVGLVGGPGTADQTKPSGSVELAVKVISMFQLSVRAPAVLELAQATPTSHTPPLASSVASGILPATTAGPHSRFTDRVWTTPVDGAVLNGP